MSEYDEYAEWLSIHIYFGGSIYSAEADRVVSHVVAPVVHQLLDAAYIRSWFYIRYTYGGPHIRLRMQTPCARISDKIMANVRKHLDCGPAVKVGGASNGNSVPIRAASWSPYEPEYARYGGRHGVRIAEWHFYRSSVFASSQLDDFQQCRDTRLGRALLAMLGTLSVFFPTREAAAAVAEQYGLRYLAALVSAEERRSDHVSRFDTSYCMQAEAMQEYVVDAWNRLSAGESTTEALDAYVGDLRILRRQLMSACEARQIAVRGRPVTCLEAAQFIVPSYVHMTLNRLGITPLEEAYLAHILQRSLTSSIQQ